MFSIELTNRFLKDLKLARKRKLPEEDLNKVIQQLASGNLLDAKYKDHSLKGNYAGLRECHIKPDWLLVYKKDYEIKILTLLYTGTHSDLF